MLKSKSVKALSFGDFAADDWRLIFQSEGAVSNQLSSKSTTKGDCQQIIFTML